MKIKRKKLDQTRIYTVDSTYADKQRGTVTIYLRDDAGTVSSHPLSEIMTEFKPVRESN